MTADAAYNAGIDALARGNTASAVADLASAHDLAPRDAEIAAALANAREQTGSLIHAPEPWPVSSTELGGALVLVSVVLAALIALRRPFVRNGAIVVAVVAALWLTRLATTPDYAIVAKADAATHVVPDTASLTRFTVHQGDELAIESRDGDWLKVRGPDGTRAFIETSVTVSR